MFFDIIKGFLLGVFGIFLFMFVYLPLLILIFLGPILMVPILSLIQLDTIPKVIMDCTVVIVIACGAYRYIKKNTFPAHLMVNGNYLPDDKDWGKKHLGKADAWLFLLAEQGYLCIEEKGKSYYMIKLKDYDGPHKAIQSWFKQTFKKKNAVRCFRPFVNGDSFAYDEEVVQSENSKKTKETKKSKFQMLKKWFMPNQQFLTDLKNTFCMYLTMILPLYLIAIIGGPIMLIIGVIIYMISISQMKENFLYTFIWVVFVFFLLFLLILASNPSSFSIDYFFKSIKIFDIFTVVFIFLNLWFLQYKGYFYFIQHKNLNLQTKAFILFINDVIKRKDINLIKQIYLNDTKYGLKVLPYITYMGVEKKWFKHFDFLYDNHPSWLRLKYGTFLDFLKKL